MLVKTDGEDDDSATQLFMLSNISGTVENIEMNERYDVSFELNENGASMTLELDPIDCEDGGQYMCAAIVGDPTNATDAKYAVTQLNVSSE